MYLEVERFYNKLLEIFLNIDQSFFNLSDKELFNSKEVKLLSQIFPEWYQIIKRGFKRDEQEAIRTLKHTYKTLHVYFSIVVDKFDSNLSSETLASIRAQLKEISDVNPIILPLVLLLHDIGRPFNRTWHTIESKKIIYQKSLLDGFDLEDLEKFIILIVIEHHLLIGTIFTGESSYLGSISLWRSIMESKCPLSDELISIIFQCLAVFTIIDIWGYDYSIVYDHYFDYYTSIRIRLAEIFKEAKCNENRSDMKFLENKLLKLDNQNLKWRTACSLRIFQFIHTKHYLTERFYYSKIENGLEQLGMNWNEFESRLRNNSPKIQFKYTLGILMILAMKEFRRKPINKTFKIELNIFRFWIECSKIVEQFLNATENLNFPLFYYIFDLPRTWFLHQNYINRVRSPLLIEKIRETNSYPSNEIFGYITQIKIK